MDHSGHCFECGAALRARQNDCSDKSCQVGREEMPVWPWSRCHTDREWLARVVDWRQLLREYWAFPLGIALFLIGFLALSGIVKYSGLVIIGGWALTRFSVGFIRRARARLVNQEQVRDKTQHDFDAGIIADIADGRKRLDDENDRVKAYNWMFFGAHLLRSTFQWGTVCALLFVNVFWGPGDIFPWSPKIWAQATYRDIAGSPPIKELTGSLKTQLRWDEYKILYLYDKLVSERLITWEQFEQLRQNPKFDPDLLLNELKKTDLMKDALFNQLTNSLVLATIPATAPIPQQAEKGWLQIYRESLWATIWWAFWFTIIVFGIHVLYGIGSIIIMYGWYGGDELRDQARHNMERILEKHGVRQPKPVIVAAAAPGTAPAAAPGAGTEEVSSYLGKHMFSFALITSVLEIVVDKLLGRLKGS